LRNTFTLSRKAERNTATKTSSSAPNPTSLDLDGQTHRYEFAPFRAEGSTANLNGDNGMVRVLFPNVELPFASSSKVTATASAS
jgi:hypothetical protein